MAGGRAAIRACNHFDLHSGAFRQRRNLHSRASRRLVVEVGTVDFVYDLEIAEVSEEDRRFRNVSQGKSFRFQKAADVIQHSPGLLTDVIRDYLAASRVERNLATAEY